MGRSFSFDSKLLKVKQALKDKLENLLNITDSLPVKPQHKLRILSQYIHGQLLFDLRLYSFSASWVDLNLDSLCTRHIRDWLDMPPSSCVRESSNFKRSAGGLGIDTIQHRHQKMTLLKRHSLRSSNSEEVRSLAADSSSKLLNAAADSFLDANTTILSAVKSLRLKNQKTSLEHLLSLKAQGAITRAILSSCAAKEIKSWSLSIDQMASCIFSFVRKGLLQILPTNSLLFLWKRSPTPLCPLCNSSYPQTNKHVLSNCGAVAALHRYTNRHNDVLRILLEWLRGVLPAAAHLYADLPEGNFLQVRDLFKSFRPDISVVSADNVLTLELTVCHETNLEKSHAYKAKKYLHLQNDLCYAFTGKLVTNFFIEVTTLGLISDMKKFTSHLHIPDMAPAVIHNIRKHVVDSSFQIYCNRNNDIIPS